MERRRLIRWSVVALTAAAVPALAIEPVGAFRDRDCSDFRTQREAQRFFRRARRRTGQRDAHGLDADGDGKACEHLP